MRREGALTGSICALFGFLEVAAHNNKENEERFHLQIRGNINEESKQMGKEQYTSLQN